MFGWEFPPHNSGGLGVACYGLSRALHSEGAEVTFVLPRRLNASLPGVKFVFADRMTPIDSRVVEKLYSGYATPESVQELVTSFMPNVPVAWSLFDEVIRYAMLARMVAHSEQFDVIHAHDWLSFLAGIEAKRVSGKPFIAHVHATEYDRTGGAMNDAVYQVERRGMEMADHVVAVSGYTKRVIMERYGISGDKISVVHNGIDNDDPAVSDAGVFEQLRARKKSGGKTVLFVGRLTLQKGPDYFLSAAKRALSVDPTLTFVISGSGDMENRLMQDAAYMGIADRVFFVGFLRGAELAAMYRMADLVVMPSVSEPFGIVPLESLLNGTPVLISKQSGVSEVVSHALKVDFWDTEAMAERMLMCTKHASLHTTLAENGKREAAGARWQRAAEKCILIYNRLCNPSLS